MFRVWGPGLGFSVLGVEGPELGIDRVESSGYNITVKPA